jgi:hypothetical protein
MDFHGHALAREPVAIAICYFVIIIALVGSVGVAAGLALRHIAQTLPPWVGVVFGARGGRATGWIALPLFLFWLTLVAFIWLYLLGVARISGDFSPVEIAMTIIVGAASAVGIAIFARFTSSQSVAVALATFVAMAVLQIVWFRISFTPAIAHR